MRYATLMENGRPVMINGKPAAVEVGDKPMVRTAHVSGNQVDVFHCPFCGSGDLVSRSDGSIECGYCDSACTVTVSPMYPAFPMSMNGQPYPWPGRPEGDPNAGLGGGLGPDGAPGGDPDGDGNPFATEGDEPGDEGAAPEDGEDDDDEDATEATVGGKKQPPFGRAAARRYWTASGTQVDLDNLMAHVAIKTADDPQVMAARVRQGRDR